MTSREAVELPLCRSALWEALACGFRPPTSRAVERLATPDGAAGLRAAATVVDPALVTDLRALASRAPSVEVLLVTHGRLFGHTVRGGVPAYETEYGVDDTFRQPQELADLSGFYRAFGLRLADGVGERPDHVSCECEFLLFLARKEAVALERADTEMLETTRTATRNFLRDHVGRFLPAFASRVAQADPGGFYGALARFGERFVRLECARLEVPCGLEGLGLRVIADDGVPMACGGCERAAPDQAGDDVD